MPESDLNKQEDTRVLRFWYIAPDGARRPLTLHVDKQLTIRNLEVDGKAEGVADLPRIFAHHQKARKIRITKADEFRSASSFFVGTVPCDFEGCEELRERYNAEIAELEATAQEQGRECTPCEKGDIMRKYAQIVAKMKEQQKSADA